MRAQWWRYRTAGGRASALVGRVVLVLAVAVAGVGLPLLAPALAPTAQAAVQSPFGAVFSTQDNGAVAVIGSSSMNCPDAASGCAAARSAASTTISSVAAQNNNSFAMTFVDVDSDASTANSSTSTLAMPAGSTVLNARLVWGGRLTAGTNGVAPTGASNVVKLRAPGQGAYTTLSGSTKGFASGGGTASDANPYQGSIDVTAAVRAAGNGVYSVGDIQAATGTDRYAGWSLVVAYRNPALPLRDLSVFEGFADVTTSSASNSTVDIPISGFLTPRSGAVNARVGVVAWEGDSGTIGDALALNGTTLSDAARPANNFFDSKISDGGTDLPGRTPGLANNFGVDVGTVDANNVLPNGATSTTLRLTTTGDYYYPGVVTSQIDLFTPSFNSINKSVTNLSGNTPARPGDTLEYTVAVTNTGADSADNTVVRDTLPANVTYVPGSLRRASDPAQTGSLAVSDAAGDDVGEYSAADRTLRVRAGTGSSATAGGTLAPNQTTTVVFRATLDRAAAGTTVANTGQVDYRARTIGRDYTFAGTPTSTPVRALADLAASKTSTPASQDAGGRVTYTIGATNNGPNATGSTTLVDTLPAGVTFVSASPPAGTTCSVSGSTLTCTGPALAVGATRAVPVVVDVPPATPAGPVTNTVRVSSDLADDVPTNDTASAATQVTRSADLAVTAAAAPSPVVPGQNATLTSTVTNNGPSTAEGVVLSDAVPAGTRIVSATLGGAACTVAGQSVSCPLPGPLAPGASATATVTVAVDSGYAGTTLAHTASASASTADPATANNTATATVGVAPATDLAVTITGPPAITAGGGRYTYVATVTNTGPSDARDVVASSAAPNDLVPVDVSASSGTCTFPRDSNGCRLGTIPAGASVRVTIVVDAPASLPPGTQTVATRATTSTPETDPADDTASTSAPVSRSSDLAVAITPRGTAVTAGQTTTFVVDSRNAGPSDSGGTTTTVTLPQGLTATSATYPGGTCAVSGQTVTCPFGTFTPGQSVTTTIAAAVAPDRPPGPADITATIAGQSPDPATANNTAVARLGVDAAAYLALGVAVDRPSTTAGEIVTYTYSYVNNGPSTATGVTITDSFGAGRVTGGTCTPLELGASAVTCDLGTLAPGQQGTVTVSVRIDPDQPAGPVSDAATLAAAAPVDPNPSNNSASATTQITRAADLTTTISGPQTPVVAGGDPATYTVRVTNNGPSSADNTVVIGDLPAGVSVVSATIGGAACTVANGRVTCPAGLLAPGTSADAVLTLRVAANVPAGPLTLAASADSTTPDPTPDDSRATVTSTVATAANLQAAVDADPAALSNGALVAGTRVPYRVTVTDAGPSDAAGITFSTTLPVGLTLVSATPELAQCSAGAPGPGGQRIDCTLAGLSAGAGETVTLVVAVAPDAVGPLAVDVTAAAQTTETVPGDNTARRSLPVVRAADLSVGLGASPEPVPAGGGLTYTAQVTNNGPSVADAVTVRIALPAGVVLAPDAVSSPPGTTCAPTAARDAVDCTLNTVAAGTSVPVVVRVVVPSSAPAGTVTATATAASPTADPDVEDRTATVTSTVTTAADLAVTVSPQSDAPLAGGTARYTVSTRNDGPSDAASTTVTVTLPERTSVRPATTSGGAACTVAGRTVTCPVGTLGAGRIETLVLVVDVDPAFTGPLTVDAAASSPTPDPDPADNRAGTGQTVGRNADLAAGAAFTGPAPVAGRTTTYRLSVTDRGPATATAVRLGGPLPAGTTLVSTSPSPGGTCAAGAVQCTFATLAVGATAVVDVTVAVGPDVVGPLVATATVAGTEIDPVTADDTATAQVAVSRVGDLAVTSTLISGSPTAGGEVRFQVAVRNDGPSRASGIRLTDPAVSGLRLTAADLAAAGGTCTVAASGLDCALADLAVGAQTVVTVTGVLDSALTGPVTTRPAVTSSGSTDPDPSDDAAPLTLEPGTSADVAVSVAGPTAPVVPGTAATWQLQVRNGGPSVARGVVVTDRLPDGVTVTGATGPGATCTPAGSTVTCSLGDLPRDAVVVVTVTAAVDPSYTAPTVRNDASVRSGTSDPDPTDDVAATTTPVAPSADLATTVQGPAGAVAGSPATWTVRVRNDGPSDAAGVTSDIAVPPGLLAVSATGPGGACTVADGVVRCPVGVVAAGTTAEIRFTGTLDPAYTGPSVTITATTASPTSDPDPSDASGTATTPVGVSADLRLTQTVGPSPVVPGGTVSVVSTLRTAGPSTARAVTVTVGIPDGLQNAQVRTTGGTCAIEGPTARCTLGDLAAGETVIVTVTGVLDPAVTAAALTTSATATSPTPDPTPGDATATTSTPVAARADLAVGTAVTSGPPTAGAPATFEATLTQNGPSVARGVVLDVPVPDGVVLDPATVRVDQGACTLEGSVLRCRLGDVAPGATVTVQFGGTVAQDVGPSLTLQATAASATTDPDPTNDTSSSTATVGESADLLVTAPPAGDVVAGTRISVPVTVTNGGPSIATATVVRAPRPPNLTGITVTGVPAGTCTVGATEIVCALGDLPGNTTTTFTISGLVDPSTPIGDRLYPIRVASGTPDPDTRSNVSAVPFRVVASADLAIATTIDPNPLTPGRTGLVTVVVTNNGPSTATGVTTEALPEGLVLAGDPRSPGATCRVVGGRVSCDLAPIGPGASVRIEVPVNVAPSLVGDVTVLASLDAAVTDPAETNNQAQATAATDPRAALRVALSGPERAAAGRPVELTATVTDAGPSDARDVVTTLTLPADLLDPVVVASRGTCTVEGRTVTCRLGAVAAGADPVTITVRGTVSPAAGASLEVAATATSPTVEPDPQPGVPAPAGGRTATPLAVPVDAVADLAVGLAGPQDPVPGQRVSYLATVRDDGPATARGVVLRFTLPAGLTDLRFVAPPGVVCDAATTTCSLPDVGPGVENAVTVGVSGVLPVDVTGPVTGSATVGTTTTDPDPGDNTASAPATARPSADVRIEQSVAPAPLVAGGPVTWTVRVTNDGPSTATGLVITDQLPAGVTDVVVTGPAGVVCDGTRCTLDALAPGTGSAVTLTVTGRLAPGAAPGPVVNTVTVDTASVDPDPADDSATLSTPVTAAADLTLGVTGPDAPVPAGTPARYTVAVSTAGPSTARDVTVTVPLPAGFTAVTGTASQGTCRVEGNALVCRLGDVAPGVTPTITVDAVVDPAGTGSSVTLGATATSGTTDPSPGDDSASATTAVERAADLGVTVAPSGPLVPGGTGSYTVTVTDRGPATARGATATVRLPAGVTPTAPLPAGCVLEAGPAGGTTLVCTLGDLAPGTFRSLTIPVTVAPDADPATGTTTVTVGSASPDPMTADNTATASGAAAPQADLVLTTPAFPPAVAGTQVTSTSTVLNRGPSAAPDVRVTVTVPAEITGAVLTPSVGTCGPVVGGRATCSLGTLAPGRQATVTVRGTVDPDASGTVPLGVAASSAAADPQPGNNTTATPLVITPAAPTTADVSVRVTPSGPLVPGTTGSYRLQVDNAGPATARTARATLRLPAGVTAGPLPAGCSVTGDPDDTGQTVTCVFGDLAAGAAPVLLDVPVSVAPDADVDGASVTATVGSGSPDPDTADNTAVVDGPGAPVADLAVTSTPVAATTVGQVVTSTSTVTNDGPSDATGVTVTVTVPAELSGATVSTDTGSCGPVVDGVAVCDLGTLEPQQRATVTVTATTTVPGTPAVGVAVTSDGAATDPAPGNNATSTPVAVTPVVVEPVPDVADLGVTKQIVGAAVAGADVTWDVTVTNTGPATARGVTLVDRLPAGIGGASAAGCSTQAVVSCPLGDLAAGETRTARVAGRLDPAATGALANAASAFSATPEATGGAPNIAVATDAVDRRTGLSITKTADRDTVAVGEPVTWTITVRNSGPSSASDVVVVDDLPGRGPSADPANPDATISVESTGGAGTFDEPTRRFALGVLAPGGVSVSTLTARVVTPGDLTNRVVVGADGAPAEAAVGGVGVADPSTPGDDSGTGGGGDGSGGGGSGTGAGTSGSDGATSVGTATSPDTAPTEGLLAYTGAWLWPILALAGFLLVPGAVLLLLARRRREETP